MEHKKMADYAYHYGLKVRIYPSQQQKEMIRRNADAARCVYNEHVAVNKEIARFGRRSIYIDFIEKHIETPITMVSNGPERHEILKRTPKI